jgi:Methyltransferase domain
VTIRSGSTVIFAQGQSLFSTCVRRGPGRHSFVIDDACDLPFLDRSFDIVFSNSAIEHVGTWQRQIAFARKCNASAGRSGIVPAVFLTGVPGKDRS